MNQEYVLAKEHTLVTLFHTYAESANPPILELQDINHKPVGALYTGQLKFRQFHISETNNSEKYYLYIDGVGIYFSFYKKISL